MAGKWRSESRPIGSGFFACGDVAQLGEHCLCKAGVAGSTPVVSIEGAFRCCSGAGPSPERVGRATWELVGFAEEAGVGEPIHWVSIHCGLVAVGGSEGALKPKTAASRKVEKRE